MKTNEASVFVFMASVIIGILISLNINFNRDYNRVFLSAQQYQDAYNDRNKLINDISSLQKQYDDYNTKLNKYKYGDKNQHQVLSEMESELLKNKMSLGTVDVEGQGIKITLSDASTEFDNNQIDYEFRVIHNTDMIQVINDLKNSGAEAISINGQRIIDRSEIICDGPFLKVNGVKIPGPFTIYAIGKSEVLKNYMLLDDNYIEQILLPRNINVDIIELDKVKIPAYEGIIDGEYLSSKK
ncbi:DUF881 domain-containing protein [Clostridium omnivorum]|uniref:DUF881 domain-containing protein n=1 Tax=Clostridium omnivorum TaxID=1604902 RepID=A0ABQ5NB21_9CLOT|nr:DUF881 domain-containing protein [Clostridium sp. E14]GLC32396.1 hypothetical protein bsdE14_38060 [Clostridium sp. E14]